jgi:hypothetical protein
MKLYIDIDGVILNNNKSGTIGPFDSNIKVGVNEFIDFVTKNFDCYWLTAWSINGEQSAIKEYIIPYLPRSARSIKFAKWVNLKTEGIDLSNYDWLWIDDQLLRAEYEILVSNGMINNYIKSEHNDPSIYNVMKELQKRI